MLLGQLLENRLLHASTLDKRRVRLDDNITLVQPLGDIITRAPRVNLILADGNLTTTSALDVLLQFLQLLDAEVGDTDRTDVSCLLGLNQGAPCSQASLLAAVGRVNQDAKIDISRCADRKRNAKRDVAHRSIYPRLASAMLSVIAFFAFS